MRNEEFEEPEEPIRGAKDWIITFRVDKETFLSLGTKAKETGQKLNEWMRDLAVGEATKEGPMTPGERVLFEEVARLRFITGNGLKLLATGELTLETLRQVLAEADEKSDRIAQQLLEKRKTLKSRSVERGEKGAGG